MIHVALVFIGMARGWLRTNELIMSVLPGVTYCMCFPAYLIVSLAVVLAGITNQAFFIAPKEVFATIPDAVYFLL